jgi:isoleucyl-tRNA synthetase
VLKDRLYTFAARARERRSAQTTLVDLLKDLIRLVAPLLAFTAEEAWQCLPAGARTQDSVHLAQMPEVREEFVNPALAERWAALLGVRSVVLRALEQARRDGLIGNSLEAKVIVKGSAETFRLMESFSALLPSVFIVSQVELFEDTALEEPAVRVVRAEGAKCVRCWNYSTSVGTNPDHQDICDRCVFQVESGAE